MSRDKQVIVLGKRITRTSSPMDDLSALGEYARPFRLRLVPRSQESALARLGDRLCAIGDSHFFKNVLDFALDGDLAPI